MNVRMGRTFGGGRVNLDLPDADGGEAFNRLAYLLVTEYRATPKERPLHGPDQVFWTMALPADSRVMLHCDGMAGSSISAAEANDEPGLRMLAHWLSVKELPAVGVDQVRLALQHSVEGLPKWDPSWEAQQAAYGGAKASQRPSH